MQDSASWLAGTFVAFAAGATTAVDAGSRWLNVDLPANLAPVFDLPANLAPVFFLLLIVLSF